MNTFQSWSAQLLGSGLEPKDFTFLQITLRGMIVFAVALVMVRLSDRRSLSKKSPFDIILLVILASVLSRAINGSASFFSSIGGAAMLVVLHRLLAFVSSRSRAVTAAIKGQPAVLVRDGKWEQATLRRQNIAPDDVLEDMRLSAKVDELDKIKVARLEVSGDISFILAK